MGVDTFQSQRGAQDALVASRQPRKRIHRPSIECAEQLQRGRASWEARLHQHKLGTYPAEPFA